MKKYLIVLSSFFLIFVATVSIVDVSIPENVYAQEEESQQDESQSESEEASSQDSSASSDRQIEYESFTSFPGVGRISTLCELTDALWQLGIIVLIASVFGTIVYAGFKYVTAGVNVNGVSEAKQRFMSAITGLILGLSSVLILGILNVDLLSPTCTLEFVGAGTNAFDNLTFGGPSSGSGGEDGTIPGGPVPDAGTPCDDGSGLQCIEPGDVSSIVITSCFYRNSNGAFHGGTDWVVIDGSPGNNGAPVAAMTAGVVVEVCRGGCSGFGNNVTLRGPSQGGFDLYNYSHLTSIAPGIEEGMEVGQGTILGGQGCTGSCRGTHVDTKISNCLLCKRQGSHYTKPTAVIRSYLQSTYGVSTTCNCRNGCNDT